MKLLKLSWVLLLIVGVLSSCNKKEKDPTPNTGELKVPATYVFTKDSKSTVSFSGQTARIKMATEIVKAMSDTKKTSDQIKSMLAHKADGKDFSDASLNTSSKNVKGKIAASKDYFSSNATEQAAVRADFDKWVDDQVNNVFPNWGGEAEAGKGGYVKSGSKTRYVNAKGLEMNQVVNKALIGALLADQINNNYTSAAKLDAVKADHEAGKADKDGVAYTTMEHNWDEGYGYLYGTSADKANPNATIGKDDIFLNKYTGKVDGDADFKGVAQKIFDAFKKGRAAIVAKKYDVRNEQASIIRENVSKVIAVRAVHYLLKGKAAASATTVNYATLFHDLSEAYGFVYSLQFTRKPGNKVERYFTRAEIDAILKDMMDDGANGLWDVKPATLQSLADKIAKKFGFEASKTL